MTTATQLQTFVPSQGQQQTGGFQKQSDPFWYKQNASYLYAVTNAPSNPQLGIESISLKPASSNQVPHGILANGILRSAIGSISFQVRMSPRTNGLFVQTISSKSGQDAQGNDQYWEHIVLNAPVKAQILRHFEALQTGQPIQMPMQQQMGMPQQQFGMQPQYGMQPQMGYQQPMQQMGYGMQQQPMQQPMGFGMQQPMQQQFQQFNQFSQQPAYTPPVPQDIGQQQPAEQQSATKTAEEISDDELPV